jgi:peptidoglycan/xylan/chitin deacetylase (PgdA/CDA1 family)
VDGALWPGEARGALSLSFDNLGEVAEIELGAIGAEEPLGDHVTATTALPALLEQLMLRNLRATFFVEGLNTELYPAALLSVWLQNHELGYHAWRHEQWADLAAAEQAENLARGIDAFRALGIEIGGMRPPGGGLGAGGLDVLRGAGLRYCSPAGEGVSAEDGIVLLPFRWRHVDVSCVLPQLASIREQMVGSAEPLAPERFLAFLERELERLVDEGGYATIVLHLFMLEWLGRERLGELLDRIAEASRRGDLWVAPCGRVADHVLADRGRFEGQTILDTTSWASDADKPG